MLGSLAFVANWFSRGWANVMTWWPRFFQENFLGVCRLVSSLAGAPVFYYAGSVSERLGVSAVMMLSMGGYALRYVIYGLAWEPWQVLPAEALRGGLFALFWSAATFHVFTSMPENLRVSMVSVVFVLFCENGPFLQQRRPG